jgi:hypothetical protein
MEPTGHKLCPIWLLGDSRPKCYMLLRAPLDPRHPTRHSIWTPVLDRIQHQLFLQAGMRLDATKIYIRNAVGDPRDRDDLAKLQKETASFGKDLIERVNSGGPHLLITFGAFSYEFAQKCCQPGGKWQDRTVSKLGSAFRREMEKIGPRRMNILPLLHASIARGEWHDNHLKFCGPSGANLCDDPKPNYFDRVADIIASFLIQTCERDYLAKWCLVRP